jgi:hypothetical protein
MKALAGPAMMLVLVGGYAIYKGVHHDDSPSRSFTELELAAADADHTGTCYALSTVLVANGMFGNIPRTWSLPDKRNHDRWMLTLENVRQGYNGPQNEFQKYEFERYGTTIRLVSVDASQGYPTDLDKNIDHLLEAAHDRRSTPVARCLGNDGHGYRFPPRN